MNDGAEDILRKKYCAYRMAHRKKYIYLEVPVFSRSVDLVEVNSNSKKITAIEFKISDWKRAISQLSDISVCFDYLVLCVPKPKTDKCLENIVSSCSEKGIGLILWDQTKCDFIIACKPIAASVIWKESKKQILKYLKEKEVLYGR